jgi:SAM-dependent methyltransferase
VSAPELARADAAPADLGHRGHRGPPAVVPSAVTALIAAWAATRPVRRVLEAGCGSTTHFRLPAGAELVGLDLSETQLRRHASLDRRILGDVQSHDFGGETFDLVICWNVLEHVPDPAAGLRTLAGALAPGALLVVGVPNLWSVKGVVTKLTPFGVHRTFYRLLGDRSVGTEAFGQFPTVLHRDVAPRRLRALGEAAGLTVRLYLEYEGPVQETLRARSRLADGGFAVASAAGRFVSRGRFDPGHSDAVVALERPVLPAAGGGA